jgi:hypothetical protein
MHRLPCSAHDPRRVAVGWAQSFTPRCLEPRSTLWRHRYSTRPRHALGERATSGAGATLQKPASTIWPVQRRPRRLCDRWRAKLHSRYSLWASWAPTFCRAGMAGSAAYALGEARRGPVGLARHR